MTDASPVDNEWLKALQDHLRLQQELLPVVALSKRNGATFLLMPASIRFSDLGDIINAIISTTIQLAEAQELEQEFIFRLQTALDILSSNQGTSQ